MSRVLTWVLLLVRVPAGALLQADGPSGKSDVGASVGSVREVRERRAGVGMLCGAGWR